MKTTATRSPALSMAIVLLGGVTVIALVVSAISLLEANRLLNIASVVAVGMTQADVLSRLGNPMMRIPSPSEGKALLYRGGYWVPTRPISGELLVWRFRTPLCSYYRLYVYIDTSGMVECAVLGGT